MKEIIISRKTINATIWIVIIAVLFVGAASWLRSHPDLLSWITNRIQGGEFIAATDLLDAQAAVAGVSAFYTFDYMVPVEEWEDAVCATLTSSGCEVFKALYSPGLRSIVEKNQWRTNCMTRAVKMVEDGGDRRVWLLEATQDHPLPGSSATFQVYAEVARDSDGAWRMTHVLNNGEASRFASTMP